jgi:D-glycero-alpha-D-manno-heptose-7-phosphate kinase
LSEPPGTVTVTAPCRADLAGGTLDIWPLGQLHPGALTVNMAIPVLVGLEIDDGAGPGVVEHIAPDGEVRRLGPADAGADLTAAVGFALAESGGIRVRVLSQAPLRSGLGGSSAYGVALACGIDRLHQSAVGDERLVALVRDLEARLLGVPTGEQDHWAAVRGGVLAVHLEPGGNRVEGLEVDQGWLRDRATVFFTGIRHRSGMVNWRVVRRRLDGDRATREAFDEIVAAAKICRDGLLARDEAAVAAAIAGDWRARRRLAPEVSPAEVEGLVGVALAHGATAVKACGAGGGGSLLIWHPAGGRDAIVGALAAVADGGSVLSVGAELGGCRTSVRTGPVRGSGASDPA